MHVFIYTVSVNVFVSLL